ncbi:MAG: hypothetical protein ABI666_02525 [Ferruginibacter sp.]
MQNSQAIFESLFKRNFSDEGNENFLNEITASHPYFSPAQFYLLQKSPAGSEAFQKQAAKTNILFNNPYWLNFQLQQVDSYKLQATREENILARDEEPLIQPEEETANNDEDEKEIEPMKIELKIPAEKNTMDEMPLFEPMHMVDYFASQGIKLSEDVQSTDKLGKQLRSFTEWLKTMKKVHVDHTEESSGQTDSSIQSLAEKSNKEDDILTVSMADVFAKQGKVQKAIEVLEKLSLLNPAKNAYFAAKIEHLKGL